MKTETIEMANRNFAARQIRQMAAKPQVEETPQPRTKRFGPLASITLFALSMLLWMATMLLWMATIMMLNAGIQGMVINWLALAAAFIGAQVTLFAAQY